MSAEVSYLHWCRRTHQIVDGRWAYEPGKRKMTARIVRAGTETFVTDSVEHAQYVLSRSAIPYHAELATPREFFSTCITVRTGVLANVSRVQTRGRSRIHAALPEDGFGIVLCRSGVLPHTCAGEEVEVCSDVAFVHSAGEEVEALTPSEYELYFYRIDHQHITTELEKLLDHPVVTKLKFRACMSLKSVAASTIANRISELYEAGEWDGEEPTTLTRRLGDIERRLLGLLLESQRHNYSRLLNRCKNVAPFQVRLAKQFMEANAESGLTLGDIAAATGTNARTLQYGFQKAVGCSPLQYLKQFRLERSRYDLQHSDEPETVTEIAARWGFFHFGRFALEYGKAFGEKPSETLGRRRRTYGAKQ